MSISSLRRPVTVLALAALAFTAGAARAEFKDPLTTPAAPTGRVGLAPMTAVVRVGPQRLVAAGWRGLIAVSDDQGRHWKQAAVPVREDLSALAFPTAAHGWAVGNDGVLLESTDGGLSWVKRLDGLAAARLMVDKYTRLAAESPDDKAIAIALKESNNYLAQAPARPFLDIAFENEQTGYIVGTYNMIFRTTDAGKTWEPWFEKTDNPNGYNLYAIRVAGDEVYLAGELGLALRLDRSAQKFVKLRTPYEGSFFALTGPPTALIAAGLRGNALRSGDGGETWQKLQFSGAAPTTFSAGTVAANGAVVMVTLSGQIFVSADGGPAFKALDPTSPMRYSGVAAAGPNTLVLVGTQGIRLETYK